MDRQWLEVTITCPAQAEEAVTAVLHDVGASGVVLEDTVAPECGGDVPEGMSQLSAYFDSSRELLQLRSQLRSRLQRVSDWLNEEEIPAGFEVKERHVPESDWAHAWKEHYQPTCIDDRLVIVPAWEQYEAEPGKVVVRIDPGMAFGSGTHDSTRFALWALREALRKARQPVRLLDVGTGSGILALAALKLGEPSRVVGIDIDAAACRQAQENAELNDAAAKLELIEGDVGEFAEERAHVQGFSLLTANLTPDLLLNLAPALRKLTAAGGLLVLSGITKTRKDEVTARCEENGFAHLKDFTRHGSEWVAVLMQRNGRAEQCRG